MKAETLFCQFLAEHNLTFLLANHFSDLVKMMFPGSLIAEKFKCKRTKSTQIVKKEVLAAAKKAAKDYADEMKENFM